MPEAPLLLHGKHKKWKTHPTLIIIVIKPRTHGDLVSDCSPAMRNNDYITWTRWSSPHGANRSGDVSLHACIPLYDGSRVF